MSSTSTPTTRREQVEAALDRASQMFGLMGRIVTTGVPGHVEVPVDDLRAMVAASGLDIEIPDNREKSALTRALKALEEGGLIEEIDNVPGVKLVYALMRRRRSDAENEATGIAKVGYTERYMVAYYYGKVPDELRPLQLGPDPMIFFCEDRRGDPREAERALRPLIERYRQVYIARQIQEHIVLKAIYGADAFPVHPRGLYYYISKANEGVIEKLRAFLDQMDAWIDANGDPAQTARCFLRYMNIPATPEDQEQISAAALDMLLGEMRDIRVDLGERAKNPDKVKQDTEKAKGTATRLEERIDALLAKAARLTELGQENLARVATEAERLRRDARALRKGDAVIQPEAERGSRAEAETAVAPTPDAEGSRGRRAEAETGPATSRRRRPAGEAAGDGRAARG